jgi:hypothetical protein
MDSPGSIAFFPELCVTEPFSIWACGPKINDGQRHSLYVCKQVELLSSYFYVFSFIPLNKAQIRPNTPPIAPRTQQVN